MATSEPMSGVHFEYKDGKETKVASGVDSPLPASPKEAFEDASSESPPSTKVPPAASVSPPAKVSPTLAPEMPEDFDIAGSTPSKKAEATPCQPELAVKRKISLRGWIWVFAQFSLFALILAAPRIPLPEGTWPTIEHNDFLFGFGATLAAVSVGLLLQSIFDLGKSFSVFPEPSNSCELKTYGSYGLVRHPMYLAEILLSLSVALLTKSSLGLSLVAPLAGVLVGKAKVEEKLLHERFGGEFAKYRHQVKRFMFLGF